MDLSTKAAELRATAALMRATFPPPDSLPPHPLAPDPLAAAGAEALEIFADLYETGIINDRPLFQHLRRRIERIRDLVEIGLDDTNFFASTRKDHDGV